MLENMGLKHYCFGVFLFIAIFKVYVVADDDEECSCVDFEIEEMKTCKDWDDVKVNLDVKIEIVDGHGVLKGTIRVHENIDEGVEITLFIVLKTPKGDELVYSAGTDLCMTLNDKTTIWWPLMEAFNTTECPIPKGNYELNNVKINLSSLNGFLIEDCVGVYELKVSAELTVVKYFCAVIEFEIYHEKRLRNECENPQD